MRYTLRQIEYFVAAGEAGSIRQASDRLAISQPSISTAIAHLETELKVQLFVRHHAQGLSLTPIGRVMLVEARRLLHMAEGLYASAAEAAGEIRGRLSVGAMVTLAPMVMPELAHEFMRDHPGVEIHQVATDQEALLRSLRQVEIDIALTYDLDIPADITFMPLASLAPHVVLAENHPLAKHAEIALEELANEPMILLDLPLSRDYFLSIFHQHGLLPFIHARASDQQVTRTMVANGYGYMLANARPRSQHALDGKRCVCIPLSGRHRPMVLGIATLASAQKSKLLTAFEEHCGHAITDQAIPGMAPLVNPYGDSKHS